MDRNDIIEPAVVKNEISEQPPAADESANQQVIAAAQAEHSETVTLPAESAVPKAAVPPEKPKKKGYIKMFISAVLACCVVAGGLWAARTFLVPSPESVIKKAVAETFAQQQQLSKKAAEAVPAYLPLFESSTYKDGQSDFELNINSKPNRHENDIYMNMPLEQYFSEAYKRACRVAYRYSR